MKTNITYNDAELLDIAKAQKAIIFQIPMSTAANVVVTFFPFLTVVVGIISLVLIYQLATVLRETSPWLFVLLGIIPCINLIALLIIKFTSHFRAEIARDSSGPVGSQRR